MAWARGPLLGSPNLGPWIPIWVLWGPFGLLGPQALGPLASSAADQPPTREQRGRRGKHLITVTLIVVKVLSKLIFIFIIAAHALAALLVTHLFN